MIANHIIVQTRVSAVLTNAPIMLNMDCDMFANNPQVILHAMCLLLGFDDEVHSGFVQAPQMSYKALQDDPFGNQAEVKYKVEMYIPCYFVLRFCLEIGGFESKS